MGGWARKLSLGRHSTAVILFSCCGILPRQCLNEGRQKNVLWLPTKNVQWLQAPKCANGSKKKSVTAASEIVRWFQAKMCEDYKRKCFHGVQAPLVVEKPPVTVLVC